MRVRRHLCTRLNLLHFGPLCSAPTSLSVLAARLYLPGTWAMFSPPRIAAPIIRFLLFVCPLHLSVSFICLRASFRPWSKAAFMAFPLLEWKSHTLPSVSPPRSNARLCPAEMSNQFSLSLTPARPPQPLFVFFVFVFLNPTCSIAVSLCVFLTFSTVCLVFCGGFFCVEHRCTTVSRSALCALV